MSYRGFLALAIALLAGCASTTSPPPISAPSAQDAEHAHTDGHGAGRQSAIVFVGGSEEIGDRDGFTLGLEYEVRLSPGLGVGVFAEGVSGLNRSMALGGQLYWHAVAGLVLTAGPGVDRSHDEWGAMWRLGVLYEFPLGDGVFLAPALAYDFTEHDDIVVYGLSVGYSW
jgi:hypothetical protein